MHWEFGVSWSECRDFAADSGYPWFALKNPQAGALSNDALVHFRCQRGGESCGFSAESRAYFLHNLLFFLHICAHATPHTHILAALPQGIAEVGKANCGWGGRYDRDGFLGADAPICRTEVDAAGFPLGGPSAMAIYSTSADTTVCLVLRDELALAVDKARHHDNDAALARLWHLLHEKLLPLQERRQRQWAAGSQAPGGREEPHGCLRALVAMVHNNVGLLLMVRGDHRRAARHLQRAVRLDALDTVAIRNLLWMGYSVPGQALHGYMWDPFSRWRDRLVSALWLRTVLELDNSGLRGARGGGIFVGRRPGGRAHVRGWVARGGARRWGCLPACLNIA